LALALSCHYLRVKSPEATHVGTPGPQAAIGKLALADWWLGTAEAVLGVVAAAATPATTANRAKMRMASFIVGNL
jgi:hypothetical protein